MKKLFIAEKPSVAQQFAAQRVGKHGKAIDEGQVEAHVGRQAEFGTVAEADVAIQAQLQLVHVTLDSEGGRNGNQADIVLEVIDHVGPRLGAAVEILALKG